MCRRTLKVVLDYRVDELELVVTELGDCVDEGGEDWEGPETEVGGDEVGDFTGLAASGEIG